MIDTQLCRAFNRGSLSLEDDFNLQPILGEVECVAQPPIRQHQNIVDLRGFCWDPEHSPEELRPVLIYEKADLGNLSTFMESQQGFIHAGDRLKMCADIGSGLAALCACGKYRPSGKVSRSLKVMRYHLRQYQPEHYSHVQRSRR